MTIEEIIERRAHAGVAIDAYLYSLDGPCESKDHRDAEELEESIPDLITDLLHLSHARSLDLNLILGRAVSNFNAEDGGEWEDAYAPQVATALNREMLGALKGLLEDFKALALRANLEGVSPWELKAAQVIEKVEAF